MVPLFMTSANYSQSTQRVVEWRSAISSNGLTVVGAFMDSKHLETTEERKKAAEYLLKGYRFIYFRTMDVMEGGKVVVREAMVSIPVCPLKVIQQIKKAGRYWGPLVVQTMAQCWIDFEGTVEIPGFVDSDHFPYAALILSATVVCFPFCMMLDIFIVYRFTVPSGCGPRDTSPRRAMTAPS